MLLSGLCGRLTGAALQMLLLSTSAAVWGAPIAFTPNELQVTPQFDLLDPEFSQSRARITWVDNKGTLWVGGIDRSTGKLQPANGKGIQVDPDAMATADLKTVFNGPEWLTTATTDQIVYTKFLAGQPHTIQNARLAVATQGSNGVWTPTFLSPTLSRNGPYASSDPGDPLPRISYIDADGYHYWRNVAEPAFETLVTWFPRSFYISMRFVPGQRATLFTAPTTNGTSSQVFRYWLDTQVVEQLTYDSSHTNTHSAAWMWKAPEFDNDYVMAALVNNDTELRIYRQLNKASPVWSVVYRIGEPSGGSLGSLQPFSHNGKSYVYMMATTNGGTYPNAIFLTNIDPTKPVMRQLTPFDGVHSRKDPEVFVTSAGPYIYFNRADLSRLLPGQKPENCIQCSEGLWFTDTNLGPPQAP